MGRLLDGFVGRLPLVLLVFYPAAVAAGFVLGAPPFLEELPLAIYPPYFLAVLSLAAGMFFLMRRTDERGRVPATLVCYGYEALFFGVTLLFVTFLATLRVLYPGAFVEGADFSFVTLSRRLSYAVLSGSAMGTALTALAFWRLRVTNRLELMILPFPHQHVRELWRRKR